MSRLGAIFAGGASRRFGSDKAAAMVHGRPLIEHVASRLHAQCDMLVVIGRAWPGLRSVADAPVPGLGPLGALAGALEFARAEGLDEVLCAGCDLPDLPHDLAARLAPAPAVAAGQPLLGLWRSRDAPALLQHLATDADRSMRGWMAASGARTVALPRPISNLNTPEDLARFLARER